MAQNAEEALDWAKHEGEILDLFVIQNKTLKQVMAHMTQKHEFRATYAKSSHLLGELDHKADDIYMIVRGSTNTGFQA